MVTLEMQEWKFNYPNLYAMLADLEDFFSKTNKPFKFNCTVDGVNTGTWRVWYASSFENLRVALPVWANVNWRNGKASASELGLI